MLGMLCATSALRVSSCDVLFIWACVMLGSDGKLSCRLLFDFLVMMDHGDG